MGRLDEYDDIERALISPETERDRLESESRQAKEEAIAVAWESGKREADVMAERDRLRALVAEKEGEVRALSEILTSRVAEASRNRRAEQHVTRRMIEALVERLCATYGSSADGPPRDLLDAEEFLGGLDGIFGRAVDDPEAAERIAEIHREEGRQEVRESPEYLAGVGLRKAAEKSQEREAEQEAGRQRLFALAREQEAREVEFIAFNPLGEDGSPGSLQTGGFEGEKSPPVTPPTTLNIDPSFQVERLIQLIEVEMNLCPEQLTELLGWLICYLKKNKELHHCLRDLNSHDWMVLYKTVIEVEAGL